jgi:hypothetical protein
MFFSTFYIGERQTKPQLNNQLALCFNHIFLQNNGAQVSQLMQKDAFIDHKLKSFYYAGRQEVTTRAFEAFIQRHPIKNAFLVQGTKKSAEAKLGIYPSSEQLAVISAQMATYFNWLGKALDHSATDE